MHAWHDWYTTIGIQYIITLFDDMHKKMFNDKWNILFYVWKALKANICIYEKSQYLLTWGNLQRSGGPVLWPASAYPA